jgi:tRNA(Ile)-lysidine synthase
MIEQQVAQYIHSQELFNASDKLLVTLSGGTDSVAMTSILMNLGYQIEAAHCNFQLRGDQSEADEAFVRKLCDNWNIPLSVKRFDTQAYATGHGISIQMAARDLRYEWFEQIRKANSLNYIAIAHNQDDDLETFFLNLSRGAGLKGLTGIAPMQGKIVRPLLNTWRQDLSSYLQLHKIPFREDLSNAETKYKRNLIRHELLPLMDKLNPAFRETLKDTLQRLNEASWFYEKGMATIIDELSTYKDNTLQIQTRALLEQPAATTVLHELLTPLGFTRSQQQNMMASLTGQSGKEFHSPTHKLIKDRTHLIVAPHKKHTEDCLELDLAKSMIGTPFTLKWEVREAKNFAIPRKKKIACLDAAKVSSKLHLHRWKAGEKFVPLGMKQFKKISDFLIDEKLSRLQKEQVYVLKSAGEICWVVGHRIDERFKVTSETKEVLVMELQ